MQQQAEPEPEPEAEIEAKQRCCQFCAASVGHPRFACLLTALRADDGLASQHITSKIMHSLHPLKLLLRLNGEMPGSGSASGSASGRRSNQIVESDTDASEVDGEDADTTRQRPRKKMKVSGNADDGDAEQQQPLQSDIASQPKPRTKWTLVCTVGPFSKGESGPFETDWKQHARKDSGRLAWAVINIPKFSSVDRPQPLQLFVDKHYREVLAQQLCKTPSGRSFVNQYIVKTPAKESS